MSKKRSSEDLALLIASCEARRLSTSESLSYLHDNGFDISERTFFARKRELRENVSERAASMLRESLFEYFSVIDTLELVKKNLWADYAKTDDGNLGLKILREIRENELVTTNLKNSTPSAIDRQVELFQKLPLEDKLDYGIQQEKIQEEMERYKIIAKRSRVRSIKSSLGGFDRVNLTDDEIRELEDELKKLQKELGTK